MRTGIHVRTNVVRCGEFLHGSMMLEIYENVRHTRVGCRRWARAVVIHVAVRYGHSGTTDERGRTCCWRWLQVYEWREAHRAPRAMMELRLTMRLVRGDADDTSGVLASVGGVEIGDASRGAIIGHGGESRRGSVQRATVVGASSGASTKQRR